MEAASMGLCHPLGLTEISLIPRVLLSAPASLGFDDHHRASIRFNDSKQINVKQAINPVQCQRQMSDLAFVANGSRHMLHKLVTSFSQLP